MTEAYRVGVKLVMSSNHMPILQALSKELLGVNLKVKDLVKSWSGLGLAIKSAVAGFVAEKMVSGLISVINKTKELSHELAQIDKIGGDSSSADANARAIAITRAVPGITQVQALRTYAKSYSMLGNVQALEVQQLLAEYGKAAGNTIGDVDRGFDGARDLVRAGEQFGRLTDKKTGDTDMDRFRHFVDLAAKINAATDGVVGASELYQITQQAGAAGMALTDRGLGEMAILSQVMGAKRAGTALMSINQQFSGGQMLTRNAKELVDLGILHEGEWTKGGGGGVVVTREARERLGSQLSDPLAFVERTLLPALDAKHITDPDAQIREVSAILGRATSQREVTDLVRNREQITKELDRLDKGKGLAEQLDIIDKKDVTQNLNNLSAAYTNFWSAIAGPNSENEIAVIKNLTDLFRDMTTAIQGTNPAIVKGVGEAIVMLITGLTVFAGGAMVGLIAGIGALPVVIAAGLAALGTLVLFHWDDLKSYISGFTEQITTLGAALVGYDWKSGFANLISGLESLWDKLKGWMHGDSGIQPGQLGYTGDGSGLLHRISYGPAGVGGSASTGGGAGLGLGGSASTGGGAGRGLGGSSSTGGGAGGGGINGPQIPAGITGNAFIQALRSPFAKELADPNTRMQFMGMMLSEGGSTGAMPLADAESAMNRANFAGKSLMQMLHSGFYGPIKKGLLPKFMAEIRRNPALRARLNAYINQALAGSDIIEGHTDQGSLALGDPGAAWENAHHHKRFGTEIFGDWLFGRGTQQWRQNFENRARGSAIPHPKDETHIHNITTNLDGRVVARNTVKHIVARGNMAASGGRMTDRSITRPISI